MRRLSKMLLRSAQWGSPNFSSHRIDKTANVGPTFAINVDHSWGIYNRPMDLGKL